MVHKIQKSISSTVDKVKKKIIIIHLKTKKTEQKYISFI